VALVQHPQQYELMHAACLHYADTMKRGYKLDEGAVEK